MNSFQRWMFDSSEEEESEEEDFDGEDGCDDDSSDENGGEEERDDDRRTDNDHLAQTQNSFVGNPNVETDNSVSNLTRNPVEENISLVEVREDGSWKYIISQLDDAGKSKSEDAEAMNNKRKSDSNDKTEYEDLAKKICLQSQDPTVELFDLVEKLEPVVVTE